MDLWIRSQDKTKLCKAECLSVGKNAFSEWCIYNNDIELGVYNSQEECIDILTNIQYRLELGCCSTNSVQFNFTINMPIKNKEEKD